MYGQFNNLSHARNGIVVVLMIQNEQVYVLNIEITNAIIEITIAIAETIKDRNFNS